MPLSALKHVAEAALRYDAWVLSDEIYTRLIYQDEPVPSIAALPGMAERTIICDGFSKTYAMSGWRLGYGVMPVPLADKVALLTTHSVGCTADFTQYAGLEALLGPQEQVDVVVAEYQRRRDVLVDALNAMEGVSCLLPQGAFYTFPNVSSFGRSSEWLADYLLSEAGVAVLPGTSFGGYGEGYLRLCFATSLDSIQKATTRIASALYKLT